MNYAQIKKLDEKSLKKMTEGTGPIDECLCSLLAPESETSSRKGFRASIKKAFAAMGGSSKKQRPIDGGCPGAIPVTYSTRGKGIFTAKELNKKQSHFGKCDCDDKEFARHHSTACVQVSSPDNSSLYCPSSFCHPRLQHKESMTTNASVQNDNYNLVLDVDNVDSEFSMYSQCDHESIPEPRRPCPKEDDQYSDVSEWSSGEN